MDATVFVHILSTHEKAEVVMVRLSITAYTLAFASIFFSAAHLFSSNESDDHSLELLCKTYGSKQPYEGGLLQFIIKKQQEITALAGGNQEAVSGLLEQADRCITLVRYLGPLFAQGAPILEDVAMGCLLRDAWEHMEKEFLLHVQDTNKAIPEELWTLLNRVECFGQSCAKEEREHIVTCGKGIVLFAHAYKQFLLNYDIFLYEKFAALSKGKGRAELDRILAPYQKKDKGSGMFSLGVAALTCAAVGIAAFLYMKKKKPGRPMRDPMPMALPERYSSPFPPVREELVTPTAQPVLPEQSYTPVVSPVAMPHSSYAEGNQSRLPDLRDSFVDAFPPGFLSNSLVRDYFTLEGDRRFASDRELIEHDKSILASATDPAWWKASFQEYAQVYFGDDDASLHGVSLEGAGGDALTEKDKSFIRSFLYKIVQQFRPGKGLVFAHLGYLFNLVNGDAFTARQNSRITSFYDGVVQQKRFSDMSRGIDFVRYSCCEGAVIDGINLERPERHLVMRDNVLWAYVNGFYRILCERYNLSTRQEAKEIFLDSYIDKKGKSDEEILAAEKSICTGLIRAGAAYFERMRVG